MLIKIFILLTLSLPFLSLSAKEWSTKASAEGYTLVSTENDSVELELEGPTIPKIIQSKKHPLFDIVVVDHGEVGTSCLVRIQKAYVFNKTKKKFIGVYPYNVIAVDSLVKKCKVKPVDWETYKDYILIHDKNNDQKFKITP
ncbi:MAG: hypothetical protein ACJAT2_002499 [Bacteriovoracaceae bacterium]|jgi:hypothetical protein